jgi:hypothetical protein
MRVSALGIVKVSLKPVAANVMVDGGTEVVRKERVCEFAQMRPVSAELVLGLQPGGVAVGAPKKKFSGRPAPCPPWAQAVPAHTSSQTSCIARANHFPYAPMFPLPRIMNCFWPEGQNTSFSGLVTGEIVARIKGARPDAARTGSSHQQRRSRPIDDVPCGGNVASQNNAVTTSE